MEIVVSRWFTYDADVPFIVFSQISYVGDSSKRTSELDEFHTLLLVMPLLPCALEAHATSAAQHKEELREETEGLFQPTTERQS